MTVRPRFTESQLAKNLGKGIGATRAILEQLEHEGLAERDSDDRWAMTAEAWDRWAAVLADLRFAS